MGGGSASGASDAVVTVPSGSGRAEGDFATAKTSVWWDIENCHVPKGCDAHAIAKNISTALANMGYKGMISSISAYGDTRGISSSVQEALNSTGIGLNHVPAGVKDASDKKILVDMLFWAVDNPPPANYLLISGDRDFSNALHQLRLRRYNILLAHAPNVAPALVAAAQCVWQWASLVNGGPPLNQESSKTMENTGSNSNSYREQRLKGKQSGRAVNNIEYLGARANGPSNGNLGSTSSNLTPKIQQADQLSMPRKSFENSDTGYVGYSFGHNLPPNSNGSVGSNMVKEAPHEFFGANILRSSSYPNMEHSPTSPNLYHTSHQVHPSLVRPSDLQSSNPIKPSRNLYASNAYNNTSFLRPTVQDRPSSAAFPTANLPDISRMNISNQPHGVNYSGGQYQQNLNPSSSIPPFPSRPEFRPPTTFSAIINNNEAISQITSDVQFNIEITMRALHILKMDKMTPTESNIADCIHYGIINLPSFNVKLGLDQAIRNSCVVKHGIGASLPLYVGKHDSLWKCVNVMDLNAKHPKMAWDAIHSFLTSSAGLSALMGTECRYQAALLLKKSCLKDATTGDALQILNLAINIKKWIIPHLSGWQPLAVTLPIS